VLAVFHLIFAFLQDVCMEKARDTCEKCSKCLLNVSPCETQKTFKTGITLVAHVSWVCLYICLESVKGGDCNIISNAFHMEHSRILKLYCDLVTQYVLSLVYHAEPVRTAQKGEYIKNVLKSYEVVHHNISSNW
jgi:hypothetical protein